MNWRLQAAKKGSLFILLFLPCAGLTQSKPILIQPQVQQQRLDGFGFSIGHGCARQIQSLPEPERKRLFELLFGTEGAHCNIVRTEVPWTGKRLPMTHPLYLSGLVYSFADDENETAQYNFLRDAARRGEILINLSLSTPPAAWKTNASAQDGGSLREERYEDYANYLFHYLNFYKTLRNLTFHYLSLQNSPDLSGPYPSCLWKPEQLSAFLKVVAVKFQKKGASLRFLLPEVGWDQLASYLQPFLQDQAARDIGFLVSAHSKSGSPQDRLSARETSRRTNLKLWQTEYALPAGGDDIAAALGLAKQMMEDLCQAECTAWLYGTVFQNSLESTQAGLLQLDKSSFKVPKSFWAFSQISRFLGRDYVRVSAAGGTAASLYAAFRNPLYKELTVIFVNPGLEEIQESLEMRGWNFESPKLYRTSASEDCRLLSPTPTSGQRQQLTLPPQSISTLTCRLKRIPLQ